MTRRFLPIFLSFLLLVPVAVFSESMRKAPSKTNYKYKKNFKAKRKQPPQKKTTIRNKNTSKKSTRKYAKSTTVKNTAQVESMRNKVEYKSNTSRKWKKASSKTELKADDIIRTGTKSLARVKLEDGSRILLLQNSQAELENISSVEKTIKLVRGRIRAIVKRLQSRRTFKVKTPIGVASVRGTDFEVGYDPSAEKSFVEVRSGQVGVSKLGEDAKEVILNPGQRLEFDLRNELMDPMQTGALPINRSVVQAEVVIAADKARIVDAAATELRNADYQTGKSLIDVNGRRVRVEEYITRPQSNQFKLVSLNHRDTRFDYFTYTGTFNTTLPDDLSIALRQIGGQLGSAPDYYLTDYEMYMSNTLDNITDVGGGGHLVQIDLTGGNYILTGPNGGTTSIPVSTLLGDGSYRVYNPFSDKYTLVTAENLTSAMSFAIRDGSNFRNFTSGDTYYKTRFNTNALSINGTTKSSWAPKMGVTHIHTLTADVDFTNPAITTASEFPNGTSKLHNRLSLFYSDGSKLVYDNYIIDDDGNIADASLFTGLAGSAEYLDQLLQLNYQTVVTATEFGGRSIDLVIDPRIGTMSGLIQ